MNINNKNLMGHTVVLALAAFGVNTSSATDITNKSFELRSSDCAYYTANYESSVKDVNRDLSFSGAVTMTASEDSCTLTSNSIPNHDFNNGSTSFRNDVKEIAVKVVIPRHPQIADESSPLKLSSDNAMFRNGVKLDILAAACYGVGGQPLGREKIGCGDRGDALANPWRYDPLSPANDFGTDSHHAHAQPDGSYHYHAGPQVLFGAECDSSTGVSPVIGFAADGFPIYGSCINAEDGVRKAKSSFVLKEGQRVAVEGYVTPETPHIASDNYDGQFRGDYEYVEGAGDLDECNGMIVDGQYGYFVTDSYPWVMSCFRGTPDDSFQKARPAGGPPKKI